MIEWNTSGSLPLTLLLLLLYLPLSQADQNHDVENLLQLSIEELINLPITSTSHFDEDSLHVGSTVSIITKEEWQQRGARRMHDALLALPSVVVLPNFLGQNSIRIRGYAQSDARGIETLWDGVPLSSFNLATADVDRPGIQLSTLDSIEVIRGPGSAFHGAGAFHGAVSLNTYESDSDATYTSLGLASNGYYNAGVNLSRAIGNGHRIHVALGTNGQPDQDFRYQYTDIGTGLSAYSERDYNYTAGTAVVKLHSDQHRDISYKASLYYDNNDQNRFHGSGQTFPANDTSDNRSSLSMGKFSLRKKLGPSRSLEAQAYFWKQIHDFNRPLPFGGNNIDIHGEETRNDIKLVYRHDNLPANTQLSMAAGSRHEKINYAHRTITNPAGGIVLDADLPFTGTHRTIGYFLLDGKTSWMEDKLTLRYGFRYDRYSDFGNQITPRLGLIHTLNKQESIKLLYGNAFRAPTAIEIAGSPFITGDPNIQPETIDTYELAYVRQTQYSKLEAAIFTSKWKDSITAIDTTNNTVPDQFANVGDNSSRGLEVSFETYLDQWTLKLNGSYVRSENDTSKREYAAFPRFIFNIGAGYRFDDKYSVYLNNRIHLKANDGSGEGGFVSRPLRDYWRTDLNLTNKHSKNLTLFANIRNLFARDNYLPNLVDIEGGIEDESISLELGLRYNFQP